ncbi:uncharacterized protein LOC123316901 [Coccinella septempunctata]|uniref:uncharacterized protein LOC123316901 n=1 Tax=Coccinella septempunctata TaxID=41139 RepID=UPI001D06A4B2|nr:uncharacterized protein LOC123316901 [Coccinella septempunctata]XP_044759111.1 uncharacterized protein LOC123316901 [Coccinella septempunctata]
MTSRPNFSSKTGTHKKNNSSVESVSHRSDSAQSVSSDYENKRTRKYGHHRSKSSVHDRGDEKETLTNRLEFRSTQGLLTEQGIKPAFCNRPTSLYPLKNNENSAQGDPSQPEKEPIQFEINLVGAPPEVTELVNNIKQVAEQFLYHWKTFPIVLPNPLSHMDSLQTSQLSSEGSLGRCRTKCHLRDLFIAPSFDELDAVAVDTKGENRKLTGKQLEYIREKGQFYVESINFPGQKHCWKLSELLQKGTERSRESLLNDLALAMKFLVVIARGRIFDSYFSIVQSAKSLIAGLLRILDLLIGLPSLQTHNLDTKIKEERNKYLVAELVCRPENEDSLELLCSYIKKQLHRAITEKFEVARECSNIPVSVPYTFLTPSGVELDLRLWDKSLMRKAIPILVTILEKETRGWFLHFREKLIAELRAQKMADSDIEQEVNEAVMKEYLQRVYSSISSNPDIQALGDGVAQLLIQQAQSVVLMHKATENVQRRLSKTLSEVKTKLNTMHPVLSRVEPWLQFRLGNTEIKFVQENQWSTHEEALNLCNSQKLVQTVYFLNRDLTFMKEREPALLRELRKVKTPTRSFLWPTQIWLPMNWVVRRNFQGQSEVIPTVLSKQATTITTPRSDPSQPVFLVEKEVVRTTTTRWPMWRIFNYFHRTWCWTWNAMFFFGVVLPWCSPVGLRALLNIEPFMPDLELSQVNGTLFPRKSSLTPTLTSRLISLWRHISKSRTHFETKPDTGFIGKGFTRHINRIWNYVVKGLFGTIALLFGFPIFCLTIVLSSLVIAFTAVLWMPLITLLVHIMNGLIYDADSPLQDINRFFIFFQVLIINIGVLGILQPIAAIFVGAVVCPLIALFVAIGGVARYWFRLLWDAAIFHSLIKKRGRVPACDSFVVKRIAGPGLASDYYFQISTEQALAAFEAKMEWDELNAFQSVMENTITQPQKDFSQFVDACFGSFSTQLAKNGPYKNLEKEGNDLVSVLHEKLERRRRDLQTGLSVSIRSKVKLTTNDLKVAIQQGAMMLERYYPHRIMPKLGCTEEQFWDGKALLPGDWAGLAALLYSEIFSLDILTPLDHTDTSFRLDPHPQADLSRFTEMVQCVQLGAGGPDLLGNVYTPRGNIQVHSPFLDVSAFNPRSKKTATGRKADKKTETSVGLCRVKIITRNHLWMSWKKTGKPRSTEKMIIPLPIPHPAHIAVTIYNRDSDDPIPLESDICQNILQGIEDSHASVDETVGRFQGGASSYETTTTSSSESLEDSPPPDTVTVEEVQEGSDRYNEETVHHWTLSNWSQRKRNNLGSVRVDLASPEDVTLDSDSTRVVFSTYGTTV